MPLKVKHHDHDNLGNLFYDAAADGKYMAVKMLLEEGTNVNIRDRSGSPPLHAASLSGHVHVMQLLLNKNADIESETRYGDTPLHHACMRGKLEAVELLLDNNANINSRGQSGTPLHNAMRSFRFNIVKLLVEKGADILLKNNNNETPGDWVRRVHADALIRNKKPLLDLARVRDQEKIEDYLLQEKQLLQRRKAYFWLRNTWTHQKAIKINSSPLNTLNKNMKYVSLK